jgi:hypothetical protein
MSKIIKLLIKSFLTITVLSLILWNCKSNSDKNVNQIIIGLDTDLYTLNPLFTNSETEANIS